MPSLIPFCYPPCYPRSVTQEGQLDIESLNGEGSQLQTQDTFFQAACDGDIPAMQAAINKGVAIDAVNAEGVTALILSVVNGHVEVVTMLLSAEADPNIKNNQGRSALMLAARQNLPEIVKLLLTHGAEVNSCDGQEATAFVHAAVKGHVEVMDILLPYVASINLPVIDGNTPLMGQSRTCTCLQ